jgi:hypothetical protein
LEFLADRAFSNPQRYSCQVRPLARLVRELDIERIDFLKIDVEKAERDVIDEMDDHVWAMTRQVAVEVHDVDGRAADRADTVTVGPSVAKLRLGTADEPSAPCGDAVRETTRMTR